MGRPGIAGGAPFYEYGLRLAQVPLAAVGGGFWVRRVAVLDADWRDGQPRNTALDGIDQRSGNPVRAEGGGIGGLNAERPPSMIAAGVR